MKKYFIAVIVLISLGLLGGCATRQQLESNLNTWVGMPESKLISEWGPPHRSYESGGRKYLTYGSSGNIVMPGVNPSYTTTIVGNTAYTSAYGGTPAYNVALNCDVTFEIVSGIISSWSFRGNNCVTRAPREDPSPIPASNGVQPRPIYAVDTAEKDRVIAEYNTCLKAAATMIDDLESDISLISEKVMKECDFEYGQAVKAKAQGLNDSLRKSFESMDSGMQSVDAMIAVLNNRGE